MPSIDGVPPPSEHAYTLAGWPLTEARPPRVESLAAREVVVVVSRSRDPRREVLVDHCISDRVSVVQRPSGGGAVVLAPGVVVASALHSATPSSLLPEPYFAHFCTVSIGALERCGVYGVIRRGISDLSLGDRKIAGTSLRLWRGLVLFQIAVLVDADLSLLDRYLREPTRAPDYRAGRTHRQFVTSVRAAGHDATCDEVATSLRRALAASPPSKLL